MAGKRVIELRIFFGGDGDGAGRGVKTICDGSVREIKLGWGSEWVLAMTHGVGIDGGKEDVEK